MTSIETFAMANCSMLLSKQQSPEHGPTFSCKTCGRKFPSFQALGGHRASHNKHKPAAVESPASSKPKTHACSICGLEFPIGQALGGHMRRHRALAGSAVASEGSFEKSDGGDGAIDKKRKMYDVMMMPSVLKKSNSCKRICLPLDLNFYPWKEVDEKDVKDGEEIEKEKTEDEREKQIDFLKLELRPPINCW